jgi:hypothetical protein
MPSNAQRANLRPGTETFANFANLPSTFAKLLEEIFCGFAKNPNLPSGFANLVEMLL